MTGRGWSVALLGEVTDSHGGEIRTGPFGSQLHQSDYVAGEVGVPVVMPKDMAGGYVDFRSIARVDPAKAASLPQHLTRPGDILLARRGDIGRCALVRDRDGQLFCGTGSMRISVQGSLLHPQFLHAFLCTPGTAAQLEGMAVGATMANLNAGIVRSLPVPVPPLAEQVRIASILSAYDDLIENNMRRIQILEEMAQAIYREWFVEFRFPGHEGVRMVDSEVGPIPEGWRTVPASTAMDVDPRLKPDPAAVRPFVPMTSVSESSMHIGPIEQRRGTAGAKFQNGDTLFARITPCLENGKTAYVQALADGEVGSGSTEFIVLRSRLLTPEFVYLLARSDPFRAHAIKSMSGATGRQRVRANCFDSYVLPVPPQPLLSRFRDIVKPMFTLSHVLFRTTRNLREARDLLLPRLISGEVDVSKLDIGETEPAA